MQQERIAENIYFFQSELYAQVNAGAVVGGDMAVVIDTLALPEETLEIRKFIERELQVPVRYVINTHYHADHTWGNAIFPDAFVIGHRLTYEYLRDRGIPAMAAEKERNPQLRELDIVLPHITFDEGQLSLLVGKRELTLFPFPGHSADNTAVLVEDEGILFCGDTYMPLPYIVDGDFDEMTASLKRLPKMSLENLIPGHGDVVLRGEIEGSVKDNLSYLSEIRKAVRKAHRRKYPLDLLEELSIDDTNKSRILIGGMADQLHRRNLTALYEQFYGDEPEGSEVYYEEK